MHQRAVRGGRGANRPLCPHGPVRSRLSLARGSSPSWGLGLHPRWGCVGCDEARERGAGRQRRQDVTVAPWGGRTGLKTCACGFTAEGQSLQAGVSSPESQRSSLHRSTLGLQAGSLSLHSLSLGPRNTPNSPNVRLNFLVSTFPLLRRLNQRGPGRRPFPRETHKASK